MSVVVYVFIIGLAVGSFVNALVWRMGDGKRAIRKKTVDSSRSICEHCHRKLLIIDLIPVVSWMLLRGHCRYCDKAISWRHPAIELLSGLVFALSWLMWPSELIDFRDWLQFALWLVFLSGLLAIAVYDYKHLEIANSLIYPLILLAIFWRFIDALVLSEGAAAMKEMALGLLVGAGLFLLLFYLSKEKWIGGGDVKLGFFLGAWLGPAKATVALAVGFYLAFAVVIPLLLAKKLQRSQPVPFGPFLIIGVYVATLWGQQLTDWYRAVFI